MKYIFTLGVILFLTFSLFAQESYLLPAEECYKFANVYLRAKNLPDSLIISALPDEVKREWFAQGVIDTARLTNAQRNYMDKVTSANDTLADIKAGWLKTLCEEYDLDIARYHDYFQRYRGDLVFQRSLMPCFESVIQQLR